MRGVSLFKGHYKNPDADANAFDADDWFDTGDIIGKNEASSLFFSEWDKDLLRVESENVAASKIETMIIQIGRVTGCTVIGRKDFMLDEASVAFIIPNDSTPSDLRDQIVSMHAEK